MWHFCSAALSQKIERIQERALKVLYNDNYSSYSSLLLKAEQPNIEVSRLRRLAIEVFKTLKSLNPDFMYTYFTKGSQSGRRIIDIVVNRAKTTTFGEKSLKTLGPKLWNPLPEDVKNFSSTIYRIH